MDSPTVLIDKTGIPIEDEPNLLELIRKAGIELPTFCYDPELSIFGSCRMCLVEVEGRGLLPACSIKPEDGMVIQTNTKQVRDLRKMFLELMLSSHEQECTTCPKNGGCRLQSISKHLDVTEVRFKHMPHIEPKDLSSDAIARDMSKCILCGDCVRVCDEKQSVRALNFTNRGIQARVMPAFNKDLADVECVSCGQCVKACPVGALTVKPGVHGVWAAIHDSKKTVVVQVAPAARKALRKAFGEESGAINTGKTISALRVMGFDRVYDTVFSSDFVMAEVGKEFEETEKRPLFTSTCPAWTVFAEYFYPDLPGTLSSCKSPQQMFGVLCKDKLAAQTGIAREDLVVVSVMPCAAKKNEACLDKNAMEVDHVLTPDELIMMIEEMNIVWGELEQGAFDEPFTSHAAGGAGTGALQVVTDMLEKDPNSYGIKTREADVDGKTLKIAVVTGLANARELIDKIKSGEETFDLIKIMSCTDGCAHGHD